MLQLHSEPRCLQSCQQVSFRSRQVVPSRASLARRLASCFLCRRMQDVGHNFSEDTGTACSGNARNSCGAHPFLSEHSRSHGSAAAPLAFHMGLHLQRAGCRNLCLSPCVLRGNWLGIPLQARLLLQPDLGVWSSSGVESEIPRFHVPGPESLHVSPAAARRWSGWKKAMGPLNALAWTIKTGVRAVTLKAFRSSVVLIRCVASGGG